MCAAILALGRLRENLIVSLSPLDRVCFPEDLQKGTYKKVTLAPSVFRYSLSNNNNNSTVLCAPFNPFPSSFSRFNRIRYPLCIVLSINISLYHQSKHSIQQHFNQQK